MTRRVFGMTEAEWYAQGNPPGSFDDIIEMAMANSRAIKRAARVPHPWDEWDLEDAPPIAQQEPQP